MKTSIIFYPERGGLGDGIVGCASALILSQVLDADFYIDNGPIQFYNYFDIPEKYKNIPTINNSFNYEPSVSHDNLFKNTKLEIFIDKSTSIKAGSNFYRFLYSNEFYKGKILTEETSVVKHLFDHILIPKREYLDKLNEYKIKYDIEKCVGVQIRIVNFKDVVDSNNPLSTVTIDRFIDCFKSLSENNKMVLTTDYLELCKPIIEKHNIDIITIQGNITHSIRSQTQDYEKNSFRYDDYGRM